MKIGILGTGHIGATLVKTLSAEGHQVKVANSRGPETIDRELLASGAQAVTTQEALSDVDAVIISIPLNRITDVAPLIAALPEETVVIDTSNYYPFRDDRIEAIEAGQVESLWVAEQLGRPIAKAWNAFHSGSLADSWRQQPGAPAYCTDLTREEMGPALAAAERARLPKRRDLGVQVMQERLGDGTTNPDADWGVRLVRAINM